MVFTYCIVIVHVYNVGCVELVPVKTYGGFYELEERKVPRFLIKEELLKNNLTGEPSLAFKLAISCYRY